MFKSREELQDRHRRPCIGGEASGPYSAKSVGAKLSSVRSLEFFRKECSTRIDDHVSLTVENLLEVFQS